MDKDKVKILIETELRLHKKSEKTIQIYSRWIVRMSAFYNREPKLISLEEIIEFAHYLINKEHSSGYSLHTFGNAINFYYNIVLKKEYEIKRIPRLERSNPTPDILTREELLRLFKAIDNLKHKVLLKTIYSAGLDLSEVLRIRLTDIDSKNGTLSIRDLKDKVVRKTPLSLVLLKELREYYKIYVPQKLLFESFNEGVKYSQSSVRSILNKAIIKTGISKNISVKNLKYTYVRHVTEEGIPLSVVLNNIGISSSRSLEYYNNFCHYNEPKLRFSPLDRLVLEEIRLEFDTSDLEKLLMSITNPMEKDYLLEGISCFRIGALRAGIVFVWAAAIRAIQLLCLKKSFKEINFILSTIYPKAKEIKSIDDFQFIKDEYTIELSQKLGFYDKNEKSELINSCLGLRNKCGHPNNYKPDEKKVAAYIEDVINLIYKKHFA